MCRATQINEEMKMAASQALAALAKEDVPDSVSKAYGGERFRFGREYLIPKPFDYRVLLWVAPAVARGGDGLGRGPVADHRHVRLPAAARGAARALARAHELVIEKARRARKRIVFPEGEQPKILRAAKILASRKGSAHPILLVRREQIADMLAQVRIPMDEIEDDSRSTSPSRPTSSATRRDFRRDAQAPGHDGLDDARRMLDSRNVFAPMMLMRATPTA